MLLLRGLANEIRKFGMHPHPASNDVAPAVKGVLGTGGAPFV